LISNDSYDITSLSFLGIERYIFTHPQSETFLGVMRGSNINLIFISFLITGGFYITIQSMAKYKKNDNGYSVAIVIAIIPIVIKCNIEIPFVLSVFNLANAILFLSFSDSAFSLKEQLFFYFNKKISTWLCIVMWIVFLSVFVFLERHIFFRTIVN
ncbi:O-antigen ligase domain-containing protein, partial [Providencia rettgeri]|nr:O-antigen ligase domain-containing protein [Providencia rettgeri]